MHHLLSRGLGEPLRAFIKACTGLVEAASSSHITDGQVAGAAVDLVVAASSLGQRAAGPGEAVAKVLAHAAACASCNHTHTSHRQETRKRLYVSRYVLTESVQRCAWGSATMHKGGQQASFSVNPSAKALKQKQ